MPQQSKTQSGATKSTGVRYKQDYAYDYLKQAIIEGILPPEKMLVEWEICEKLNISRTPVREALRRLSSEGLVESYPGRGMFVTRITAEGLEGIYELKEALERMAVRLCILRMTKKELDKMAECVKAHSEAYEKQAYAETADMDLRFHTMLVEFARSKKIEEHAKTILVQIRRFSQLAVYDTSKTIQFIEQHREIYEAIAAKDLTAAEAAVSNHTNSVSQFQRSKRNMLF